MITNVLFISTEYIKSRVPIFQNVSDQLLRESILEAQNISIKQILGSSLYDELVTEIEAASVSTENQTLLDGYVAPALKFYTMYEAVMYLRAQVTPTGAKQLTQGSSLELGQVEFKAFQTTWNKKAEFYAQECINFLKANASGTVYPKYLEYSGTYDSVIPKASMYTSALYLGGGSRGNCSAEYYKYEK